MLCARQNILGHPDVYLIRLTCALGHHAFAEQDDVDSLLKLLSILCEGFRVRLFAYRLDAHELTLIIRHEHDIADTDANLRKRWQTIGGRSSTMTTARLRRRLGSLEGFMQILAQRSSRNWNLRHHSRGHLWAGRYRACLLADDAALLAGIAWLECASRPNPQASSQGKHGSSLKPSLSGLPIRMTHGDLALPADEAPPGCPPPSDEDLQRCFDQYCSHFSPQCRSAYGTALTRGFALGRPESLSETIARLGRQNGRGRSRKLRELDDQRGLCGVWG